MAQKVTLDACVLFPPVLREILLRLARAGLFDPVWSERILGEWRRATLRLGPDAAAAADIASRLAGAEFPRACEAAHPEIEARHILPDPADLHVLATAIASGSDAILTFNAQDFPRHILAAEGIARRDPDGFLWELWSRHPDTVETALAETKAEAERRAGAPVSFRALLKRNQLNRLARAIQAPGLG